MTPSCPVLASGSSKYSVSPSRPFTNGTGNLWFPITKPWGPSAKWKSWDVVCSSCPCACLAWLALVLVSERRCWMPWMSRLCSGKQYVKNVLHLKVCTVEHCVIGSSNCFLVTLKYMLCKYKGHWTFFSQISIPTQFDPDGNALIICRTNYFPRQVMRLVGLCEGLISVIWLVEWLVLFHFKGFFTTYN